MHIARHINFQGAARSLAGLTGALLLATCPPTASSAEAPADLDAYCFETFGPDTASSFDLRDNGLLCTQRGNQGLGLLHHRIDPSEVCLAQHATGRFRTKGQQILCLTGEGGGAKDRKVDLAQYCRSNYGPTAIVSERLTDGRSSCTVKGDGGLPQAHHDIDFSELCGHAAGASAVEGNTLNCRKPGDLTPSTAERQQDGPGGRGTGGGRPRQQGDGQTGRGPEGVPDTAIVQYSKDVDLTGCGIGREGEMKDIADRFPALPPKWQIGSIETPCPALTGGFFPDLNEFCRIYHRMTAAVLADGRPICYPPQDFPDPEFAGAFMMLLPPACVLMYPNQEQIRKSRTNASGELVGGATGYLYPVIKYSGGKLECFYLKLGSEPASKTALGGGEAWRP